MNGDYQVRKMPDNEVEKEINAAYSDGWEVVTAYVARYMYGLGGEYQAKEVQIIFRRRGPAAPAGPA